MKRSILKNLVYTDIFISFCAMAMAWEIGFLVKSPIPARILGLIFFATWSSYIFHSLVNLVYPPNSERRLWNANHKYLLRSLFVVSFSILIYLAFPFLKHPLPLLTGGILTFLYSAPNLPGTFALWLRKLAYGKTAYLAMMWAYATTLLPLLLANKGIGQSELLFFGYRFFLIYAICILFDRRDVEEDKRKGIRALPTVLSAKQVQILYYTSLFFSLIFCLLNQAYLLTLLLPIFILIPMYGVAIRSRSEFLYYIIFDGLMALTAVIHASLFG